MSCTGGCGDIQDIAQDLFEFEEGRNVEAKVRKPKKVVRRKRQVSEEGEADEVDFVVPVNPNRVPGTESIYVKTFGCSHNISDSQFMIGQLAEYGYNIVDNPEQADLILVNSCTVKNPSQDAFMTMVAQAKKIKKPLVVAGCVPQGDRNIQEINDVSTLGVTQIDRVVEVVQETLKGNKVQLLEKKELPSLDLPKIRKNKEIEIIPINSGCLGACTYCKTVFARGKLGSYTPQAIANRVKTVVSEGVREIWLTSEDTGAYGRDLGTNISELLVKLCAELENHPHVMMRFGMTNPPYMLDHLPTIAKFLNHPRVFSFIHIPVQSGNDVVLEKMNRQYTVADFKKVCDYLIEHVPELTIATDIICGFPGQTNQQFDDTIDLVKHYNFPVVNISQFYPRPGTAAAKMDKVPTHLVKQRSSKLTKVFHDIDKFSKMKDRECRIWVNEKQTVKNITSMVGHTKNYVKVVLPEDESLLYKQVIVKVTKISDWHVEGQVICQAQPLEIPKDYALKMRENLDQEAQYIKQKKENKIRELKLKVKKSSKEQEQPKEQSKEMKEEMKEEPAEQPIGQLIEQSTNHPPQPTQMAQPAKSQPKYYLLFLSISLFVIGIILSSMGY